MFYGFELKFSRHVHVGFNNLIYSTNQCLETCRFTVSDTFIKHYVQIVIHILFCLFSDLCFKNQFFFSWFRQPLRLLNLINWVCIDWRDKIGEMGSKCCKLTSCCWDSQFKAAAVVEVPDAVGGLVLDYK